MKKFILLAVTAAMVFSFNSCSKDNGGQGSDPEPQFKREYRVTSFGDNWSDDPYTIAYNANGTVKSVTCGKEVREFNYYGTTLTINKGAIIEYTMTLNEMGFATKIQNADHTWDITYDANGFLILAKKDGTQCTNLGIENGNITYWTRYDSTNSYWRKKMATYTDTVNTGCVQTHWAEDLGVGRWVWEARLVGNTSVNELETSYWMNFGDVKAEKTAVFQYERDANGCITKEIKYYGTWNGKDLTDMNWDTTTSFTWEKIN